METLVVVDAQNEFSADGKRPVANHASALEVIRRRVDVARHEGRPIAWIRHHNRPDEAPAFLPGSWGAELSPGFGPVSGIWTRGRVAKGCVRSVLRHGTRVVDGEWGF
jgi:nicotinamidase-related amidase